jgi:PAH dioxygenase large subunit
MLTESELASRVGPVLSDGTRLRDLFDLEKREWSLRLLHDPEIYQLELERIWARSWVFVGHEAEIPNAGDFMLRWIGEDQVIVTRDAEGGVNIVLNVCAHRGMQVCWADEGNQSQFKCPYHGFVFENTGKLLGAPFEQELFGDWDKSEFGLKRANVGVYQGLIFGSFAEKPIAIEDHLGDVTWYIDYVFGGVEWENLGGGTTFPRLAESNWKLASDNAGDSLHVFTVHRALEQMGLWPPETFQPDSPAFMFDNVTLTFPPLGHTIGGSPPVSLLQYDELPDHAAKDEKTYLIEGRMIFFYLFPGAMGFTFTHVMPDGSVIKTANMGTSLPRGSGAHVQWSANLVEKSVPEAIRAMMLRFDGQGLAMNAPDDFESWRNIQHGTRGVISQQQTSKYNNKNRGATERFGWPGPGVISAGDLSSPQEDSQWSFWQRWLDVMTAEEA